MMNTHSERNPCLFGRQARPFRAGFFNCRVILLFILLLSPSFSMATTNEEILDTQTREIAKTLRCAVCQSESVWESNAELAKQMRQLIRERLAQGQSPDEIRAYFLSRYGDYILMEPQKTGLNWVLWAGPFILLVIGALLLYRTVARWVAQTSSIKPENLSPIDELQRQRIDQELRSLEK
ncbi:MAG: cytochrome c-type biogenesis protein CcmH [Nitrospira sp.]|nr:cytochrome c-type biogenesis protein CcmH [Nitrospira sp.]